MIWKILVKEFSLQGRPLIQRKRTGHESHVPWEILFEVILSSSIYKVVDFSELFLRHSYLLQAQRRSSLSWQQLILSALLGEGNGDQIVLRKGRSIRSDRSNEAARRTSKRQVFH